MKFNEHIENILELTKIRITVFVMLTTAFGYVLASNSIDVNIILPLLGILLLACSAAVINHIQERKSDALMERTKKRPIPSGKVSVKYAIYLAAILMLLASVILYFSAGIIALLLGYSNIIFYNVIYTPLKKKNAFAIIPGALVGAVPPLIGWVAAGGSIFDSKIAIVSFFFFIWQIPHFWLLLFLFGKDYEQAGFPTLTKIFNFEQLGRIIFVWIISTVVISLSLPLFGIVQSLYIDFGLLIVGLWLSMDAFKLLNKYSVKNQFRFTFYNINAFVIFVIFLISLDNLFIL